MSITTENFIKNKRVINVKTMRKTNLYFIYGIETTFGDLLKLLFDNYNCGKYFEENKFVIYSQQFNKVLNFDDRNKKLCEYNFDIISIINIISQDDASSAGIIESKQKYLFYKSNINKESNNIIANMNIFVKLFYGPVYTLEVNDSYSIKYVKFLICEKGIWEIPFTQNLIFGNKQLEDDKKLKDYNIKNGSTINLVQRLVGSSSLDYETNGRAGNYQKLKSCIFCL